MMKKTALLIMIVFLLCPVIPSHALEAGLKIEVNGTALQMETNPYIQDGTTMVPFRPLFEKLGLTITWDEDENKVIGTRYGLKIELQIGNSVAMVNDKPQQLDVPARLIKGVTMVPVRFVSEAAGNQVIWDGATQSVSINGPVFIKATPNIGNGALELIETPKSPLIAGSIFEIEENMYMVWGEADTDSKTFKFHLFTASAEQRIVQGKIFLEIPFYDDEYTNKRPPIIIDQNKIIYSDHKGLHQVTYSKEGEIQSKTYLITQEDTNRNIKNVLYQVYSGSRRGVLWGTKNDKNIIFYDALDKPVPVKDTIISQIFLDNKLNGKPLVLDDTYTWLIFQSNPFNPAVISQININTGKLGITITDSPAGEKLTGGQLCYYDNKLYLFYLIRNEGSTMLHLAILDPVTMAVKGDYRNLLPEVALASIVQDEMHFWSFPESTGQMNLSVFTLP
jgi:hypothetical protein